MQPINDHRLEQLLEVLKHKGLASAMGYLNSRVPHRFTAVYRLDQGVMRNIVLHDKAGAVLPEALEAVPLQDSFCQFVLRDGSFTTNRSSEDARLDGHPYQGIVESYVALPLSLYGDDLYGTFCHFDLAPHDPLPEDEYTFMQQVVRELPPYIRRAALTRHTEAAPTNLGTALFRWQCKA